MIKTYYHLTKPGIIYGNAITTIAGFFLASKGHVDFSLLLTTLISISLIIASACVFNNIADRDIDDRMERTKNRALVTGKVSKQTALIFATILGLIAVIVFWMYTNPLTLAVALTGHLVYTLVYTPMKRRSVHATLVGAIAGAIPPVVGYTAVTNHLDLGAWLLFFILVTWQMPHFYSIAIRRIEDYAKAGIPVLPVKKGIIFTKINIIIYIIIYIIMTSLLYVYKYTGPIYFWIMLLLGLDWLVNGLRGFRKNIDNKLWSRKMFFFSLVVLLVFSLTVSISGIINK